MKRCKAWPTKYLPTTGHIHPTTNSPMLTALLQFDQSRVGSCFGSRAEGRRRQSVGRRTR